ncbi:hypothetical protein [Spirosoma sp. 209]|uniref:hypothetical protein n=1 Tax=Spirosoma sp. 209 TaxID=1955701 RepID=UPI00098D59A3|nr:hypothetical protein [Spirosoma sp. 209]
MQPGVLGQASLLLFAAKATLFAVATFFVAAFDVVAELQPVELQDDWLQVVLAFFGASVAKELTDTNRNRAERTAEMKFFMMKI